MATLFFDGFDRGTTLKRLDPNYWSSQYSKYPKYSFGAYPRIRNGVSYTRTYEYYSPNNGVLPTFHINNNYYDYPAFGSPVGTFTPGFLALSNIPIDDEYNEQPITYLQLSGFPSPSGTKSYLGMRCLGIETKHQDYWDETVPLVRFGYKHPLVAFCSGNTTGLILNIVAVTGDNLLPLVTNDPPNNEGRKITIGLEVEQNGGISGVFDLNVSDVISEYRITPYYCGGYYGGNIPTNNQYKSLIIAHSLSNSFYASVISRWTHFEIEIDNSNNSGLLSLKIEGADSLVIDNTPESNRENWNIKIPINKFSFDNIRFFNRTYKSNTISSCGYDSTYSFYASGAYYGGGSVTLYDDITLIDNTGNDPKYYLGPDSKVLTLYPGHPPEGTNLNPLVDDHGAPDGLKQWSVVGTQHHRVALATNDNDITHVTSYTKNSIDSIRYTNLDKDGANWRLKYNDGIGGVKVYNSARKGFLDTNFMTVGYTGPSDQYSNSVVLLIHADEDPILDYSPSPKNIELNNSSLVSQSKFGSSGLSFFGNDSYMIVKNPIDPNTVPFTIESWVQFTGNNSITLFDRRYKNNLSQYTIDGAINGQTKPGYEIICTTGYIDIIKHYFCSTMYYDSCIANVPDQPATFRLLFPSGMTTGVWHHVALTRSTDSSSGWYTAYLNGNSGTGYLRINMPSIKTECLGTTRPYSCSGLITDSVISGGVLYYNKLGNETTQSFSKLYYDLDSTYVKNSTIYSLPYIYIGKSGLLDEYRVTSGVARYSGNFIPPTTVFKSIPEDYFQLGPEIQLDRTTYKVTQFYEMNNPATNAPWSSGDIMTSGIILGVKKT